MTLPAWREEAIAKHHDRKAFDCGQADLNDFLRLYARQSHERGAAKTFVAVDDADGVTIFGYYSLGPASMEHARVPEQARRGLGKYEVGAYRLGRLAIARGYQGRGLGGQLLLAAGYRCLRVSQEAGGTVLLIDAKNDAVAGWYASYGAVPLLDAPLTLVLPLGMIAQALAAVGKL